MARLKRDLLKFTGNVNFYRVGNEYIVFQADKDRRPSEALLGVDTPGTPLPRKESTA